MIVRNVQDILESWAPREIAWERDNVGLQVGNAAKKVKRILVALDVNDEVVQEARKKNIDLILTHHPLLFRPPKSVTPNDRVGRIVFALIQHDIALYSLHTNFDFTRGGVSFTLAKKLGLENITFLEEQREALRKLVVFVPRDYVDAVGNAMASAGAGIIGKYDHCSFRIEGTGTFRGGEGTKPFLGQAQQLEQVNEVRLEMIVPKWKIDDVVRAMKDVHPYEEAAYDVYVLENENSNYGIGAFGVLPKETVLKEFLQQVKRRLSIPALRYVGNLRRRIKRVAVCGGSGSDLLGVAMHRSADAFVTADVTYHAFEAAKGDVALIDAGHFETEYPSLDALVQYLQRHNALRKERMQVMKSTTNTNSVHYY